MTWSPDTYVQAVRFAADAHGDQRVPGSGHPYLVHVTSVAAEVACALRAEPGHDEDLAIACALLHDVVEDTAVPLARVAAAFGPRVAAGVAALSKDPALPAAARMPDSLRRIQAAPREVWLVKLADRTVNLTPPAPPHWTAEKRRQYRAEAETILAALGAASPTLAARLQQRLAAY
jgi:(p)ppGpp synthase/HD superfamily hydrolase